MLGRRYEFSIYARGGAPNLARVAMPYLAAGRSQIPLPPFGMLGLDPALMIPLAPAAIPPGGVVRSGVDIPNHPSLAGVSFHGQSLILRWPGEARLSNVFSVRIVR